MEYIITDDTNLEQIVEEHKEGILEYLGISLDRSKELDVYVQGVMQGIPGFEQRCKRIRYFHNTTENEKVYMNMYMILDKLKYEGGDGNG